MRNSRRRALRLRPQSLHESQRDKDVAFFIERDALRTLDDGSLAGPEPLLAAFDRNRDTICRAAIRAYGHRREGSYTLTLADF